VKKNDEKKEKKRGKKEKKRQHPNEKRGMKVLLNQHSKRLEEQLHHAIFAFTGHCFLWNIPINILSSEQSTQ